MTNPKQLATAENAAPLILSGTAEFGIPANALRFDRAAFNFSDNPAEESPDGRPKKQAFKMLARTGSPIYHWYWGQIVHDMAGFTARKDTVPIDYCHWSDEILGYADKQDANNDGLTLSGMITPFTDDDRASEVLYKAQSGVPYEASISFDYSSVEYLQQNATAEVNGQTITGPAYIVRQWTIAGSAVCPYGADGNTSTEFSKNRPADRSADVRPVNLFSKSNGEPTMSTKTDPATGSAETQTPTPADPRAELTAELKKFTGKFGAENGATWFAEGKTYVEALELHAELLSKKLTAKDGELADAETKLKNAPRGELTPVSSSDAEKPAPGTAKFKGLSGGIAKFAEGIKLPAKK